eukprot:g15980.t1
MSAVTLTDIYYLFIYEKICARPPNPGPTGPTATAFERPSRINSRRTTRPVQQSDDEEDSIPAQTAQAAQAIRKLSSIIDPPTQSAACRGPDSAAPGTASMYPRSFALTLTHAATTVPATWATLFTAADYVKAKIRCNGHFCLEVVECVGHQCKLSGHVVHYGGSRTNRRRRCIRVHCIRLVGRRVPVWQCLNCSDATFGRVGLLVRVLSVITVGVMGREDALGSMSRCQWKLIRVPGLVILQIVATAPPGCVERMPVRRRLVHEVCSVFQVQSAPSLQCSWKKVRRRCPMGSPALRWLGWHVTRAQHTLTTAEDLPDPALWHIRMLT